MTSRKPFLLRISPALYDALESWAQQELRSVNGQIEFLLKEAVRKRNSRFVEGTQAVAGEDSPSDSPPTE